MTASADALALLYGLVLEDERRWGDAATDWQRAMAEWALDPDSPPNRWESRPRGGSKTTDAGAILIALLLRALPAGTRSYVFAVDRDQARLLVDAIAGFAARTPAIATSLNVDNYKVTAPSGSVLEVLAADAASAWGLRPAFVFADEVCQWPSSINARSLWEAMISGLGKVPGAKLLLASTSGDPAHWSRKIYDAAVASSSWTVADIPGPLPWADPAYLAEQKLLLPESSYRRLHLNQWATGEDRLTTLEDLRACVTLDGPQEPKSSYSYVIGLDLGLKKDRTVATICHGERLVGSDTGPNGWKVVLDRQAVWSGTKANPVNLATVEDWLVEAGHRYRARVVFDPWQAVGMMQRLPGKGVSCEEYTFSQQSVGRLAVTLHTAIRDHRLALPPDEELIAELSNVRLRETSPGVFRMDHDAGNHDDRAISLALAAQAIVSTPAFGTAEAYLSQLVPSCPSCGHANPPAAAVCALCAAELTPKVEETAPVDYTTHVPASFGMPGLNR